METRLAGVTDETFIEGEAASTTAVASQWQLIWIRFQKHRLALVGSVVMIALYLLALFHAFISPYGPNERNAAYVYAPPQKVHFSGFRPFVYGFEQTLDPKTFRRTYTEAETEVYFLRFFVPGYRYKLLGLFPTDRHLFGVEEGGVVFLFGADKLGRDLFTRNLYAASISLSIGLVGVILSFVLGCLLGGVSGYYGGEVDNIIQRVIEFLRSIPTIPLWMALSAALPPQWPPLKIYFGITVILSLVGWTGLARVVRGKMLELREEDFVLAAKLSGGSDARIIGRHMLPGFLSYLIVDMTFSIPDMIIAETALSFLGLGLRPPVVSWGVLLQEAQNIRTISQQPWLLIPAAFVIVVVLMFNFIGDGLRDAADPYKSV
jgi:peptide/nickel transport system permease protein